MLRRLGIAVLVGVVVQATTLAAAALPTNSEAMAALLRDAIAERDYGAIEAVINWDGAGKIKRRVVAFSVRRGLGRTVKSITVEPTDGQAIAATAKLNNKRLNMPVSHKIRVVYDEPPINGVVPTAVYLVGGDEAGWRIALVVRTGGHHGD
ncbi:MAG: hypothetical protein RIM84_14115 [Alphaproteobacteria bacterium]